MTTNLYTQNGPIVLGVTPIWNGVYGAQKTGTLNPLVGYDIFNVAVTWPAPAGVPIPSNYRIDVLQDKGSHRKYYPTTLPPVTGLTFTPNGVTTAGSARDYLVYLWGYKMVDSVMVFSTVKYVNTIHINIGGLIHGAIDFSIPAGCDGVMSMVAVNGIENYALMYDLGASGHVADILFPPNGPFVRDYRIIGGTKYYKIINTNSIIYGDGTETTFTSETVG